MRAAACCIILTVAAAGGGCIKSEPLTPGELDGYWLVTQDPTGQAPYRQPTFGETKLPAKWTIRQQKSLVWSTISLVRAMDQMKEGADEIAFSVSPAHTRALVNILGTARQAVGNLADLAESSGRSDRAGWAETLAKALSQIERVARLAGGEASARPGALARQAGRGLTADAAEPLGMPAEPLLGMVALYLNQQSGGSLLADVSPGELEQVRSLLARLALRLGFVVVGKQVPADLRQAVTAAMKQADDLDVLERSLRELLTDRIEQAPPASREGQLSRTLRTVLSAAEKALLVMEAFFGQWDRMDAIELEFRARNGEPVVAATVKVLPGKTVRISDLMIAQPTLVFRGTTRIVVFAKSGTTGETVVAFEPVGSGGVELRFEGVIYGLVRLLALPMDNGRLREVRTLIRTRKQGTQLIHLAIMMEADGDKDDPRRMIVFQDTRDKKILREPFSMRTLLARTEQAFSYITPKRRYTYRRVKGPRTE